MLALERKQKVLELLKQNSFLSIQDLSRQFEVSHMTIRRDIKELQKGHDISFSGGGICLNDSVLRREVPYEEKMCSNLDLKKRMAEKAASLIEDEETILLGSGTSNYELARLLISRKVTVVTADLAIAQLLSQGNRGEIYLTGGLVDPISSACIGETSMDFLDKVFVDKVFLGCMAWSFEHGVTSPSLPKAKLKRKMMDVSQTRVLLSDHTKFGKRSLSRIATLEEFDIIISDKDVEADAPELEKLEAKVYLV